MGDTSIEWATKVWNPLRGCSKVSEGCRNCYAVRQAHRFSGAGQPFEGLTRSTEHGPEWTGKVTLVPDKLLEPLKWRNPQRVFVNSMSDLFHDAVPFDFIRSVFAVMAEANWHTFQLLTKRPERMKKVIEQLCWRFEGLVFNGTKVTWPLPNVWLGVSVENQKAADERISLLLQTPAAVRFLSCEPLLGPVDLNAVPRPDNAYFMQRGERGCITDPNEPDDYVYWHKRDLINWVIVGGESGPGARPMHPDWVRSLRDQCQAAGVPFFFKQWGEWMPVPDGTPLPRNIDNAGWFTAEGVAPHEMGAVYNGEEMLHRVGKKAAGRLLDGRTWDEFPETEMGKC
ncbi:phage Gp37/Gp68 family protein [Paenibacillus sp. Pae108]|uniref:DUF5131 family protein n=1 Tax=Paenibacillus sp. Pae108 TaxID=2926019 RepID=UPI002118986E|nr:phage Gp37/Gp68 family protein [Paenibacillus sp. Pae108]